MNQPAITATAHSQQIECAVRILGLINNADYDGVHDVGAILTDLEEVPSLPPDVYGQMLWRFPALRSNHLFKAAFGITQFQAVCEVQRCNPYGVTMALDRKLSWQIWSLAMLLALAVEKLGSFEAVDDWLTNMASPQKVSHWTYLGSPIGRERLSETLRALS
jgi:hypothetical protein